MGYAALAFREVADTPYLASGAAPPPSHIGTADAVAFGGPHLLDQAAHADAARPVDPDLLEDLGDEIAILAAHLHAGTQRLLVLIARFDRFRGWEPDRLQQASGTRHRSCAHWLAFRTGIDLGSAREKVRAARALEDLPLTSAAMARGELSFSQVRALSRVAKRENEGELLDLARGCTTAQLERVVRAWKKGSRQDEEERERERHRSRTFSVFPDDDGMYVVRGRLTPEMGALLMRAIEAASDALYKKSRVPGVPGAPGDSEREAAQRRNPPSALPGGAPPRAGSPFR